jgi:general stress protein YciG
MTTKDHDHRCKAKTKTGKPCRAAPSEGGLCFFHANPNKVSELGRKGGRSKRHTAAETSDPLPTLDHAVALRDTAARLIADVIAGKVHPRIAAGLAPLMNLQLHAIKTADLEQRLAKLEQQLKLREGSYDESEAAPDQDRG